MSTESSESSAVSESQRFVMEHRAARKRRYLKAVILIAVAVLAGFVMGVGASIIFSKGRFHRIPPNPRAIGVKMIEHLKGVVTLSDDEEKRIVEIMENHVANVEALRDASRDAYIGMMDDVESVLGPERAKAWKEYKEKTFKPRGKHGRDRKPPPLDGGHPPR